MTALLPNEFTENLRTHFPEKAETILNALSSPPAVSLRINPAKLNDGPGQTVPWCPFGRILDQRPSFALDPLFHAGAYYVQESSSMALWQIVKELGLNSQPLKALDLCAAPGGKSTLLLDALHPESLLVSNEVNPGRNKILVENLLKYGRTNWVSTQADVRWFQKNGHSFDLILLDAPCSGEGMFRKDEFARQQWSKKLVEECAFTQAGLLSAAAGLLNEGGYLIYSTCTLNRRENEDNIARILQSGAFSFDGKLQLQHPGVTRVTIGTDGKSANGFYFLPGFVPGEGLFVTALRKASE